MLCLCVICTPSFSDEVTEVQRDSQSLTTGGELGVELLAPNH